MEQPRITHVEPTYIPLLAHEKTIGRLWVPYEALLCHPQVIVPAHGSPIM